MNKLKGIVFLSLLVASLAVFASGTGLFWQEEGESFIHTTVRGEEVEIYGRGLYYFDSLLIASGNVGVDAIVLFLGVPLLLVSTFFYNRGSLKGAMMLLGSLGYFGYVYFTHTFGSAYNSFFLVYVAIFSASFYAFVILFNSIDFQTFTSSLSKWLPRKSLAGLLLIAGLLTLGLWLEAPVNALLQRTSPELLGSTTLVTHGLDLAIIVPGFLLSGILILRKVTLGYFIAFPLLVLLALLAPSTIAITWNQIAAGVEISLTEIIMFVSGFVILGLVAAGAVVMLLKKIEKSPLKIKKKI